MYRCSNCRKARAFFENEEEYIPEKPKCPKCGTIFAEKTRKKAKELTIIRHCNNCGLDDNFVYEDEEKEKPDPNFDKDRKRFCLSEEEGQKYLYSKQSLKYFQKFTEEQKEREKDKPFYDQVEKMEKLTVAQLKQLLQPKLAAQGYTSLVFSEPKIDRHFIIDFKVEDNKEGRAKYDSIQALKRLLQNTLYNTNWNLMTNGPDYRLGVLSGQLKGLESEEDLLHKVKNRKETIKKIPKS
jgi:predicted  nucleic acid-binding Zn-ribbon protein